MKIKVGILSAIIIIIDQITKYVIQTNTSLHGSIEIIENFFYITYAKNTGMGWSMLSGHTSFLALASFIVVLGLCYLFYKAKKENTIEILCYGLLISGAIGNLIDRVWLNYVRDFLDFYIFGYDFPIFNVADMAVTFGAILLIYIFIKEEMKHE